MVRPWVQLRSLDTGHELNPAILRTVDDGAARIWAVIHAHSRQRVEWRTRVAPGGDRIVVASCKCKGEEGVAYELTRWMGCMQAVRHPCIAAMPLVRIARESSHPTSILVQMGMERVDTSLQELLYGQPNRANGHANSPDALPSAVVRSALYQVLHALASCHARGVSHGNLTPYRILANTVDAARNLYLFKLADFGFSPPMSAQLTTFMPVRPSREAPELRGSNVFKRYGPANDVWALGTILMESHGCQTSHLQSVMYLVPDMTDDMLATLFPAMCVLQMDLLRRMAQTDSLRRITAAEALLHPLFNGIHDECPVVAEHLPRSASCPPYIAYFDAPSDHWTRAVGSDFMTRQPHLNARMWTVLSDWMATVSYDMMLEPRTLPVAFHQLVRYLSLVRVRRDSFQLVGLCALHVACKCEEMTIPSARDMVMWCDGAYTVSDLMDAEAHMLTTLRVQLYGPTVYDHVVMMVCGTAPGAITLAADAALLTWCSTMLLVGQTEYSLLLHPPESLARCIATLGGLLHDGVHVWVTLPDGKWSKGEAHCPRLSGRVCRLRSKADWDCLDKLVAALDAAMYDSRDILMQAPCACTHLLPISQLLSMYRAYDRKTHHIIEREARFVVDKYYPTQQCQRDGMRTRRCGSLRKAYHRKRNLRGPDDVTIVTLTAALGKQLLSERIDAMARIYKPIASL